MSNMEIKIRQLTLEDNRVLVNLIKRLTVETSEEWITKIVKSPDGESKGADGENNYGVIFSLIVEKLISAFSEDLTKLFASLLNISVEDYLKLPFDTDMVIIEQIKKAPEFNGFFQKACVAFNLQRIIGNITKSVKKRLDSMTD